MTTKTVKTILFASLIAAMILPFSTMDFADAMTDKNPKDKTLERLQEKQVREEVLRKLTALADEEEVIKNKNTSKISESEKQNNNSRMSEIKSEMDKIDRDNHKRDIPEAQMEKLINQQDSFEEKLVNSKVIEFITSVGIDITSKEIQVGINKNTVNSDNIDSVVTQLEQIMPRNANWHVVYSESAEFLACTQDECTPLIGGNYITVDTSGKDCSFGFQAKKGSTWGWITSGHCADGKVNKSVKDDSNDNVGTVKAENFYWGTSCDCAWIEASSSLTNNEIYDVPSTHTVTKTTQASQQQNDSIYKTGAEGGRDFGTVSATNVSVLDSLEGYYVKNLVRSNTNMDHGDSGGPVVESGDRGDLYGIATAHDWWGYYHTPVDQITAHMSVSVVLN